MDAFMKKLERLAEMASRRDDPVPLDVSGVIARVRGLEIEDEVESLPIRLFAGGAMAAAAAAAFVTVLGVSAWQEISNPTIVPIESLISLSNVMDAL